MRKLVTIFLLLGFLAVWTSTWASTNLNQGAVRGVAYAGKVHYISDDWDGNSPAMGYYYESVDTKTWDGPWFNQSSPKATKKFPSGYNSQYPSNGLNEFGQGVALYGALLINAAVVLDGKNKPSVLLTTFDLDQQEFLDCKILCPLGYTNSKGYGIAAAVLNNTVYIFTRNFVLTSTDGHNYTQSTAPLVDDSSGYEPLDAVAYYPPNAAPQVLVIFSEYAFSDTTRAGYVTWDGSSTLPMPASYIIPFGNQNSSNYLSGALMLGTVKKTGSPCDFPSGSTHPSVQILLYSYTPGAGAGEVYALERYEFDTTTGSYGGITSSSTCHLTSGLTLLRVFPWVETTTDADTGFYVQEQLIVVNVCACAGIYNCNDAASYNFPFHSDFMVPQNNDPDGYGWQGTPSYTLCSTPQECTSDEMVQFRNYWTLSGVVLGPPPFALNGIDPTDSTKLTALANVTYGKSSSDTIQHTTSQSNSVMFGMDAEVKAGPSKEAGSLFNLDLSYKHLWGGKTSEATSYSAGISTIMGTMDEGSDDYGTHGYAVFVAPILLTQVMELYAYDYVFEGTGTPLGQTLMTTVQAPTTPDGTAPGINVVTKYFSLQDPGGKQDEVPGLMTMQVDPDTKVPYTFPNSTDYDGWYSQVWEKDNAPWKVLYGTGSYGGTQVSTLSLGGATDITFTTKATTTTTTSYSNAISVSAGVPFSQKIFLKGLDEKLTAGYDCEYTNETSDESAINENIVLSLRMQIDCNPPGAYQEWMVQPYLLQATEYSTPWVPQGYALSLPWCIAWGVVGTPCTGGQAGVSPQPEEIRGTVAGGTGNGNYSIERAHLAWVDGTGDLKPIPLTADTFDPALGATLELNQHLLSATSSAGRWTRKGQVWTFKSKGSLGRNLITLALDFGAGTWSFDGEKLSLTSSFKPSDAHVTAMLNVNGLYRFRFDAEQEVKSEWQVSLPRTDEKRLEVTRFEGRMGWSDRKNRVLLEGRLPATLAAFGDLSFVFNGHQRDIPLLSLENFARARARGKQLVYKSAGTKVVVDFGKRKWSAEFEGQGFHRLMAPRRGNARLEIKVGGTTVYAKEQPVTDFRTEFTFKS